MLEIRKYKQSDCKELAKLFYHTVHTVNAKDYTEEQLNVWADGKVDLEKWNISLTISRQCVHVICGSGLKRCLSV